MMLTALFTQRGQFQVSSSLILRESLQQKYTECSGWIFICLS